MKKVPRTQRDKEMLDEYDFSKGERGKYARRYAGGTNLIVLAPDILEFFPDSESVNSRQSVDGCEDVGDFGQRNVRNDQDSLRVDESGCVLCHGRRIIRQVTHDDACVQEAIVLRGCIHLLCCSGCGVSSSLVQLSCSSRAACAHASSRAAFHSSGETWRRT